MSFINVGALDANGNRFKTKKALKEAFATAPGSVVFDCTDLFGSNAGQSFDGDNLPVGDNLSVVGPDPYSKRTWYATVSDGKVS